MFRDFLLFIKYPYTAGVIVTIWLGTAILMAINRDLPGPKMVIIDTLVSVVLAAIGFNSKEEL
jgi:hypothetical protein